MVALSRIKNITNEQEWMKILRKAKDSIVLVEFASSTSMGSKGMQPYMSTISRTAEYNRIKMYKVDVDLVPDVAVACGVKAIPTYQIWKSGEKIDEMSGALPQRLVTMLKTHNVQEKSKFVYLRLAATVAAAIGGVLALLKYKAEVESKEKGEREKLLVKRAEEQRKLKAQKERERIKALDARGEKTVEMIGLDEDDDEDEDEDEWDEDDEDED